MCSRNRECMIRTWKKNNFESGNMVKKNAHFLLLISSRINLKYAHNFTRLINNTRPMYNVPVGVYISEADMFNY